MMSQCLSAFCSELAEWVFGCQVAFKLPHPPLQDTIESTYTTSTEVEVCIGQSN